MENTCPRKNVSVRSTVFHDGPTVATTQMSIAGVWTDTGWRVHTGEYYLTVKRNGVLMHASGGSALTTC